MRVASWCLLLLVPVIALACGAQKQIPLGPEPKQLASRTRIVMKSGERFELRNGFVTRDSVIGIRERARRAIPRDSVVAVEEHVSPSPAPLIMLGALAIGAAALILSGPLTMESK
jgi:hypothetical protein